MENNEHCNDIAKIEIAHITMFKHGKLTLFAHLKKERNKLMAVFADNYVKFECQGDQIHVLLDDPSLRVRYRIDAKK